MKAPVTKTQFTRRLVQLSTVLGTGAALAASCGHFGWSDATLKREIRPLEGALGKLRQIS